MTSIACFQPHGDGRYLPTSRVSGAWVEFEQHISPMNGLIIHELERWLQARGDDGTRSIARVSIDILGPLDLTECRIDIERLRGGRSVELFEVRVTNAGREGVRARVWRIANSDTSAASGGDDPPLPPVDACSTWDMAARWGGGYIDSLDVRWVEPPTLGRARTWLSTSSQLVSGSPSSDLAHLIGLIDTANGIATRAEPDTWHWPNVDLTVHLHRQPQGRWLGLDSTQVWGPTGHGVTSSALHDERGHFGRAEQSLIVRPRRS